MIETDCSTQDFDFYGVTVRVVSDNLEIQNRFREDFDFFANRHQKTHEEPHHKPTIEISIFQKQEAAPVVRPFLFHRQISSHKKKKVSGWGRKRLCEYDKDHWLYSRNAFGEPRRATVVGLRLETLYEMAFLFLLSAVGEELEKKGLVRLHAAGFLWEGKSYALLMPSRGGKSSLSLALLQHGALIYSDEIVLTDGEKIYPFPLRLAIHEPVGRALGLESKNLRCFQREGASPKYVLPLLTHQIAPIQDLDFFWAGTDLNEFIESGGEIHSKFFVIQNILIGWGLPQMMEYMLRLNSLRGLFKILLKRMAVLRSLSRHGIWKALGQRRREPSKGFLTDSLKQLVRQTLSDTESVKEMHSAENTHR